MAPNEVIAQTFEYCAAADIDITPAVYTAFFSADPRALQLMGHSDGPMRGRMLDEALVLLMSEPTEQNMGYLQWEVDNHLLAYGVQLDMYQGFFDAVQAAVRSALAEAWLPEHEQAWSTTIARLQAAIAEQAAVQKGVTKL